MGQAWNYFIDPEIHPTIAALQGQVATLIANFPSLREHDLVEKVISVVKNDKNVTNVEGWEEQIPIVVWIVKPELINEPPDMPSD